MLFLRLMEKRRKSMDKIYEIMALLIWSELLIERCCEHGLSTNYEELTDCHIEDD
jgi:mRNA-degrading endonuclease YafQ of YafQ-DinJ toxin-antitoxin module